jgi:hypothetical protein
MSGIGNALGPKKAGATPVGVKAKSVVAQKRNKTVKRYLHAEGNDIIHREIPQGYNPYSNQFTEIEIKMPPIVQEIDDQIIESQAQQSDHEERDVLTGDGFTLTFKSPKAIPDVVVRCRQGETKGIADVLVPTQFLFAEPRHAEINHHTARADNAEANKTK